MIIILTGKTASGKDTIQFELLRKYPNLKRVITTTSRVPRKGEENGIAYHFISEESFRQKISNEDFLEHVSYGGNLYGTEKKGLEKIRQQDLIWRIDPSMAGKAKALFPESLIIYITVDDKTVLARLKKRGLPTEEIEKRLQDDQKFWDLYHDKYDYIVENIPGKLSQTLDQIYQIIESRR